MTSNEIWVFVERAGEELEDVSLEILGKISQLAKGSGYMVVGVLAGTPSDKVSKEVIKYGADQVLILKDEKLNDYSNDYLVKALAEAAISKSPSALLIGATFYGRDLAGTLAARLKTGLTANAVTLELDKEGLLISGVPAYGGKILAEIVCKTARPQMSTVRPGTFMKTYDPEREGKTEEVIPDLLSVQNRVKVIERNVTKMKDLTRSERAVVGGNGTGGNLSLVQKLAELTHLDLGVTRPLADKGLAPRELQVGSTGYSLKAKLALILGVSGSEHFTSGIRDCGTVISIDIDKDSEIFNHSDYCIVGDVSELVPLAIQKLEEGK